MRAAFKIFQHSFVLGPLGIMYMMSILFAINPDEDLPMNSIGFAVIASIPCGFISFIGGLIVFKPLYHYEQIVFKIRSRIQIFRAYLPIVTIVMAVFSAVVIASNDFDFPAFMVSFLGAAYLIAVTELYLFSGFLSKLPKHLRNENINRKIAN